MMNDEFRFLASARNDVIPTERSDEESFLINHKFDFSQFFC